LKREGRWEFIKSPESSKALSEYLGIEKAIVNYFDTIKSFLPILESLSLKTGPVPTSVCIGTLRFAVTHVPDGLMYTVAAGITPIDRLQGFSEAAIAASSFCVMPLRIMQIPRVICAAGRSKVEMTLLNTMASSTLDIVMWYIAEALLDPRDRGKLLFLVGSGGQGKSFAIRIISANLPGVVHVLTKDYLGDTRKLLDDTDLVGLATHRIAAYGDVEIVEGRINHGVLKTMCSGDEVNTTMGKMEVFSTGLFGVNTLWWPRKDTLKPWMTRRTLVLDMSVNALDLPKVDASYTEYDQMRFVHNCLYYRLRTPKPPITPKVLINTIFAAKSHIATRGIRFNDNACFFDCLTATWAISIASDVPFNTIILLARTICSELVLRDTESTDDRPVEAIAGIEILRGRSISRRIAHSRATRERYPADSVTQQYLPLEGSNDQVRVKTHADVIVPPWSNMTIDLGFSLYDSQSSPTDDYYVTVNVSRKQLTVGVPRHLNSTDTPIRLQLRNHSSEPVKVPASTVLCIIGEQRRTPERSRSDNCNTMTSPVRNIPQLDYAAAAITMSGYAENQSMQPGFGYQMAAPQQPAPTYQVPVTNPLLATKNVVAPGCKLFSYSPENKTVKFTMDAAVPAEYIHVGLMQLMQPGNKEYEGQPGVWITA
ncbi:hypothetical protein BDK51DRAFT_25742, partial [Blyttiomyces helicus]